MPVQPWPPFRAAKAAGMGRRDGGTASLERRLASLIPLSAFAARGVQCAGVAPAPIALGWRLHSINRRRSARSRGRGAPAGRP